MSSLYVPEDRRSGSTIGSRVNKRLLALTVDVRQHFNSSHHSLRINHRRLGIRHVFSGALDDKKLPSTAGDTTFMNALVGSHGDTSI